jgi:hypothetical protein
MRRMGSRIVVAAGYEELLKRLHVGDVAAALGHRGGRLLIENRTSFIRVLQDPAAVACEIYLKCYFYPALGTRVRYAWRASRAQREFASLEMMRQIGVPCAEPIAWGSLRGFGGVLRACFVATRGVPRAINLETFLKSAADGRSPAADPRMRRAGLASLAGLVARLHRAGYVDHDLHWRNVLVTLDGGEPRFHFIDSPKGEMPKSSRRRHAGVVHDLACLDKHSPGVFTRAERHRFLRAYIGDADHAAAARLAAEVEEKVAALHAKRRRKLAQNAARALDVTQAWSDAARVRESLGARPPAAAPDVEPSAAPPLT